MTRRSTLIVAMAVAASLLAGAPLAAETPSADDQIAASILAAPEDKRDAAKVYGYDADGKVVVLREGSNEIVCIYADPTNPRWSVACYHEDLDPFMARGRELKAQGKNGAERTKIRYQEVEDGTLELTREPRTLYVLHGSGYDAAAGEVTDAFLRWVIYVPFATRESTGLPSNPATGGPWLMGPGTAGAHIMITPPRPE